MSSEARKPPRAARPAAAPANGSGERVVPRFTPPAAPVPTRYYTGKGATLGAPPAEDTED